MRDPDLTHRLASELGRVEWPEGEELRGIARRRTRRSALAASLSVLLLLSGVWVVSSRPFQPRPEQADLFGAAAAPPLAMTVAPVPAPTTIGPHDPAWIPPEALLSPEDVGPGLVAARVSVDENRPVGNWAFTLAPCPEYPKVRRYQGDYQFRRQQTVEYPPKIEGRPETAVAVLHQTVMRLPGTGARQLVDEAEQAAQACPKYLASVGDEAAKRTKVRTSHVWVLIDRDFAGDDSLLFEHRMTALTGTQDTDLSASAVLVVRVGDLVATVEEVDVSKADPAATRKLGTRAAAWLCAAATPPC
ncbi:hypothetical protein Ais01nite_27330 [Asanoa ishikariensis]|uniref:PknH-like extracellular domain-containing protein n=1 Tax=Asanoa ishikariensis TaxID=137265 RepID=A0A1H3QUI2_9ACTN|nr:hypothetical protein [Asanoa ishikariensis]GIF64698.1 hypothetical protein Ais01nite_27330 [Asanoa ishikariensis]SDZ16923.1 hypothetical protein SAMN05421684_3189 [Asanoa ishikariensis]